MRAAPDAVVHSEYMPADTAPGGNQPSDRSCYLCLCRPKNASAGLFLGLRTWDGRCNPFAVCVLVLALVGVVLLGYGAGCTLGMSDMCTAGTPAIVVLVIGGCMFLPLPLLTFTAYCTGDEY